MKRLVLIVSFMVFFALGTTAQKRSDNSNDIIEFDKTVHDFGTITQGSDGSCVFTVTNKGENPLVITAVEVGTRTTLIEWTKEFFTPGKTAIIKVAYDTNSIGPFSKGVVVNSSAVNSPVVVIMKGEVIPKEAK